MACSIGEIMEDKGHEMEEANCIKVIGEVDEDEEISEDCHYYYLGTNLLERGKVIEALEAFIKSLELREHYITRYRISVCYDKLGLPDLAFQYIEQAYKGKTDNDKVAYEFAIKLASRNKILEAKEVLVGLLARNASYKKAQILLQTLSTV